MCFKVSFWKRTFSLLLAVAVAVYFTPLVALAGVDDFTTDLTITTNVDENTGKRFNGNNLKFEVNSGITYNRQGNNAVQFNNAQSGATIVINSGATLSVYRAGFERNNAINAEDAVNLTVTNSGTISVVNGTNAIKLPATSAAQITNNAGGTIYAKSATITGTATTSTPTITNSGDIYVSTSGNAIDFDNVSGATITNSAGGNIYNQAGTKAVIYLGSSSTLTNSGTIQHIKYATTNYWSIRVKGDNNTIILKDEGLVLGMIEADSGTSGNKLQFDHGFGRTYFYETTGDFILEDLSGNTVVKGSAGSVGQGANETADELLGLRSYNLRSTLKRYSAFPKKSDKKEIYTEPFSYYSKRGISSSVLGYDTYGYGLNIIYSLLPNKLDLVATFEKNELELEGDHDISNTNVLVGINVPDFINLGPLKASGFFVAGTGHHEGKRKILTNTTTTGVLDVTSDYTSYEAITGTHASYSYKASPESKNTWTTEVGLTIGHSTVKAYSESEYFSWKKRNLTQGSIHLGEQLTSKITDKLAVTVEGEVEGRTVFTGRKQAYAINGTTVESRDKQFRQATVIAKLGANYTMNNSSIAYFNLYSRFSNYAKSKGTYGANVGLSLAF